MVFIDVVGYVMCFEYDYVIRLMKVVNVLGEFYMYWYDVVGCFVVEVDWGGCVIEYDCDVVGCLLMKILFDGGQWCYMYDVFDWFIEIDVGDVKFVYCYDVSG